MPDHIQLAIVPGTSHGLMIERAGLCVSLTSAFLTEEPVQTIAPRRRARAADVRPGA